MHPPSPKGHGHSDVQRKYSHCGFVDQYSVQSNGGSVVVVLVVLEVVEVVEVVLVGGVVPHVS